MLLPDRPATTNIRNSVAELARSIGGWLEAAPPGVALRIAGEPGSGKSTLLTALSAGTQNAVALDLHPSAQRGEALPAILRSLAPALSPPATDATAWSVGVGAMELHPMQRAAVPDLPNAVSLVALFTSHRPTESVLLLIDGLDRTPARGRRAALLAIEQVATAAAESNAPIRIAVALDDTAAGMASDARAGTAGLDQAALDRLLPIRFGVPRVTPDEVAGLVYGFAGDVLDERDLDVLSAALQSKWFSNPRLILRAVQRYALATAGREPGDALVALEVGGPQQPLEAVSPQDEAAGLASWVAGTVRWPVLRDTLYTRDDMWWRNFRHYIDGKLDMGADATAQQLVADDQLWVWISEALPAHLAADATSWGAQMALWRHAEAMLRARGQ